MRGPLIVLSGPSGSGKSTIIRRLLHDGSHPFRLSVSVTTRQPRPNERDGIEYHFWNRECFQEELARDSFLEWAEVFTNYYGTLKSEVEPFRAQGIGVVLDIDVNGWAQVRQRCPDALAIFLRTSSPAEYERRLRLRGTESEEAIQRRLAGAASELLRVGEYHHEVINDHLEDAVASVRALVEPLFERT